MKTIVTIAGWLLCSIHTFSQTEPSDTTVTPNDTIRIGNMIIIRSGHDHGDRNVYSRTGARNENVVTNWCVVDLGFNQVNDRTDYAQAIASGYLPAGANGDWFTQHNFKSTNVNIWVFMTRRNLISHVLNLKYGAGLELNNYKYRENILFAEKGLPLVSMAPVDFRKNKLALDYITVPLMLNVDLTPHKKQVYGFSVGASVGYLYGSRQKTVGGGMGKKKYKDDFETRNFKVAYIAELLLGSVKLYGSYATESMFRKGLDMTPFSFGIRLSQ